MAVHFPPDGSVGTFYPLNIQYLTNAQNTKRCVESAPNSRFHGNDMFIGVKGGKYKNSHPIPSPAPQRIVVFSQNIFDILNIYD